MTTASIEDQFDAIAETAITDAEAIDCSLTEFIDGLKAVMQAVGDRLRSAIDEKAAMDKHGASTEEDA